MKRIAIGLLCLAACAAVTSRSTNAQKPDGGRLKFVLVLERHGVRSPTWTNARLDTYSKAPWPKWDVAPGWLTPHGKLLMTKFGAYDRTWLTAAGLLSANGCADTTRVYIAADSDERTRESGRGIADGLMPGCGLEVHARPEGENDPLFHAAGRIGKLDPQLALAALAGRIGNNPAALVPAYLQQLQSIQDILFGCQTSGCSAKGKKSLLAIEPSLSTGREGRLPELNGPLKTAASFAEDFQLEYLEGLPDAQGGWGRVDAGKMQALMALHAESSWISRRAPYLAQVQASNLLWHMLQTLKQAEQQQPVEGAIGTAAERAIFLVGHDTNVSNVAALLGVHWLLNGYQPDDTPPGGALVFELWQQPSGEDVVRAYYVAQSPEQMRHALPLSLASPPERAALFLPACSHADNGYPCDWSAFEHLALSQINRGFVK